MITLLKVDKDKLRVLIKHYTQKVYGAVDVRLYSQRLLNSTIVKASNNTE